MNKHTTLGREVEPNEDMQWASGWGTDLSDTKRQYETYIPSKFMCRYTYVYMYICTYIYVGRLRMYIYDDVIYILYIY